MFRIFSHPKSVVDPRPVKEHSMTQESTSAPGDFVLEVPGESARKVVRVRIPDPASPQRESAGSDDAQP